MSAAIYRYSFSAKVPLEEIEASLLLAVFAAESLHGETEVRLSAAYAFDASGRVCVIDANTSVGRNLCRLFTGFLSREFGADAFRAERVESNGRTECQAAAAGTP